MEGKIGITEAQYAFYMEPDCKPIRPFWLSVVDSLCRYPNPGFWIKGTIYRGGLRSINAHDLFNLLHINGNAIYNLADQAFRDFYFRQVKKYVVQNRAFAAYDTEIFRLLLDPRYYEEIKGLAHWFQFSDFIQNHWHANYSTSELRKCTDLTVIVHGGFPKP